MRRHGFSLLELVVVLGIIAVFFALSLSAVLRSQASALRLSCASNLRQIGLAITQYHDTHGVLPYARLCPAPWRNGTDPYCQNLPSPATWTGPREIWWAPYDNRPGTDPTTALPGYVPDAILFPFTERNVRIYRCPAAIDTTAGSPTQNRSFQIGYAMNTDLGGKRRISPGLGNYAWDHMDLPACGSPAAVHWTPWPVDAATQSARHGPPRHTGVYNVLSYDDHVSARSP